MPPAEGKPPFLLISDIGYSIEIYADFRGTSFYTPFPNARENRINLDDLRKPAIQTLFRTIWTDPLSLDPSREAEKVTKDVALKLSNLAKSLEDSGVEQDAASLFILRCIFTMFAEDVGLIPHGFFTNQLASINTPEELTPDLTTLWQTMKGNGQGGALFENAVALPITQKQLTILHEAAKANWSSIEVSIFGTLVEQAMSAQERHKLGAHYTPTGYVERLVVPTVMEPLRDKWEAAKLRALAYVYAGDIPAATKKIEDFYKYLSEVTILDPASGSGNFLAVSMNLMKDLEGEVVQALRDLGKSTPQIQHLDYSVAPHQFLGIESVPRAAAVSELVLQIAYLQRHYKVYGNVPPPALAKPDFRSMECRDAVLAWDSVEEITDATGKVTQKHINPRQADAWPKADFVVGNPPFCGASVMKRALGERYTNALRKAYPELGGITGVTASSLMVRRRRCFFAFRLLFACQVAYFAQKKFNKLASFLYCLS